MWHLSPSSLYLLFERLWMKPCHKNGQNTAQLCVSVSLKEFILESFVLTLSAIGGIYLHILAIFSVEPNPSLKGNQMFMIISTMLRVRVCGPLPEALTLCKLNWHW